MHLVEIAASTMSRVVVWLWEDYFQKMSSRVAGFLQAHLFYLNLQRMTASVVAMNPQFAAFSFRLAALLVCLNSERMTPSVVAMDP